VPVCRRRRAAREAIAPRRARADWRGHRASAEEARASGDGGSPPGPRLVRRARPEGRGSGRSGRMCVTDIQAISLWVLRGLALGTVFVLAFFIGVCVIVGFAKTNRTAGTAPVVKSLDEAITHKAMDYLPPTAPRGPADQLTGDTLKHQI